MDRLIFIMLAGILAGFALINIPLEGTFLASIAPITNIIGVLTILVFSLYIVYKGLKTMLGR